MILSFWGISAYFQGRLLLVSGRVGPNLLIFGSKPRPGPVDAIECHVDAMGLGMVGVVIFSVQ